MNTRNFNTDMNEMPEVNPEYLTPEFQAYLDSLEFEEDGYDALMNDWVASHNSAEMPETNPAYVTPEFQAYLDSLEFEEDGYEALVSDWVASQYPDKLTK